MKLEATFHILKVTDEAIIFQDSPNEINSSETPFFWSAIDNSYKLRYNLEYTYFKSCVAADPDNCTLSSPGLSDENL